MKKLVFALAFAAFATFSFAAVSTIKNTPVAIENHDKDPKKSEKKETKKTDDKKSTTSKSSCSKSCSKSCSGDKKKD
jgi:hypothetical protein